MHVSVADPRTGPCLPPAERTSDGETAAVRPRVLGRELTATPGRGGGFRRGSFPGSAADQPLVFNDRVSIPKPSEIRQWARASGLVTADRGRLSQSVLEAYATSQSQPPNVAATRPQGSGPRSPARGGDAPSPAKKQTDSRKHGAPASTSNVLVPDVTPEQRLQAVEAQLADALTRISALESRSIRSLLGLRATL